LLTVCLLTELQFGQLSVALLGTLSVALLGTLGGLVLTYWYYVLIK
jgi:hypothetical protein